MQMCTHRAGPTRVRAAIYAAALAMTCVSTKKHARLREVGTRGARERARARGAGVGAIAASAFLASSEVHSGRRERVNENPGGPSTVLKDQNDYEQSWKKNTHRRRNPAFQVVRRQVIKEVARNQADTWQE